MKIIDPSEIPEALRARVEIESRPLQKPGRHEIIQQVAVNGDHSGDIRVFFSREELEGLLEIAKASICGRVELVAAGLETAIYRAPSGHQYQVWKITAGKVRPERPDLIDHLLGDGLKIGLGR